MDDEDFMGRQFWEMRHVALYLGRTEETIRTWRKNGLLPPPTRIGKRVVWLRDEFLKWVKDNYGDDGPAGVSART